MTESKNKKEPGQRPIMLLIDLLGRKWLMRILWEMRLGTCSFRELQARCGSISPTVVNKRIKELIENKLLEKNQPSGYQLTALGQELIMLFDPIDQWVTKWEKSL